MNPINQADPVGFGGVELGTGEDAVQIAVGGVGAEIGGGGVNSAQVRGQVAAKAVSRTAVGDVEAHLYVVVFGVVLGKGMVGVMVGNGDVVVGHEQRRIGSEVGEGGNPGGEGMASVSPSAVG